MSLDDPRLLAIEALRDASVRITMPRVAIFSLLRNSGSALEVSEIARQLAQQQVATPLSSIYSVLSRLQSAGLVERRIFGERKAVYSCTGLQQSSQIHCAAQKQPVWLEDPRIEQAIRTACQDHGFVLRNYTLSINADVA